MEHHKLARKVEGTGNLEAVTPTCSCGWSGSTFPTYVDDLLRKVKKQERKHLRDNVSYVEVPARLAKIHEKGVDGSALKAVTAARMFYEGRPKNVIAEQLHVSETYVDTLVKQGRWFAIEGNGWCATLPTRCASVLYAAGYRNLEDIKRDLLDGTIFVKSHSPFVSSVPRLGKESFNGLCQSLGILTKQLPGFLSREQNAAREFQNGASLENALATIVGPGLMGPAKRIVKFISMLEPADRARVYAEFSSESDGVECQVRTEGSEP